MNKVQVTKDSPKACARIDLSRVKMVEDVELGAEIEVTIVGKVKTLRGPEEGLREGWNGKEKKEKYTYPGSLELEISSVEIAGIGKFDGLGEDYD